MASRLSILLLTAIAIVRIMTAAHELSQTMDEPVHIGAGLQWLAAGRYDADAEHPPLARVAVALGPWLEGAVPTPDANAILYRNGAYRHNLMVARAGNLPFFLLALAVVGLWARRLFGNAAALIAVALFSALPPILGHAGLATTDMAAAATTAAALFCFARWLDAPSWKTALLLGTAIGLGLLSKFSFIIFFPAGAFALAVVRLPMRMPRLAHVAASSALAALLVWAGYRFSTESATALSVQLAPPPPDVVQKYARTPGYEWVRAEHLVSYYAYTDEAARHGKTRIDFVDWAKTSGYPSPLAGRYGDTMAGAPPVARGGAVHSLSPSADLPVPAPSFIVGIHVLEGHMQRGHPAYLLGRYSTHGWWYYFPVVLFFKTPLPFLLLALAGCAFCWRLGGEARGVALAPLAMLLPTMASSVNIGVRHVLPLYPLLAISAAVAVVRLPRLFASLLVAWYVIAGAAAHPDYISYFNELAAAHPERIAADSNLDWGQDLLRLAAIVQREHIRDLHVAYFGTADWPRHLPTAHPLERWTPVTGWVAISEMQRLLGGPDGHGDGYRWLAAYEPTRRVGKSIRLYYIPPPGNRPLPPAVPSGTIRTPSSGAHSSAG
ncbi:MAG TPA: glycosyltransferase family 39 protein [Thermoanaerobaculia bacterium]|nr:glycosyltransferase family 39 protein [Thermoanaerobaculia bacterium]